MIASYDEAEWVAKLVKRSHQRLGYSDNNEWNTSDPERAYLMQRGIGYLKLRFY